MMSLISPVLTHGTMCVNTQHSPSENISFEEVATQMLCPYVHEHHLHSSRIHPRPFALQSGSSQRCPLFSLQGAMPWWHSMKYSISVSKQKTNSAQLHPEAATLQLTSQGESEARCHYFGFCKYIF